MSFILREKVSKNKRRYKEDGFDLDLTYITERIIAMGFPSSKSEAYYRNPLPEVQKFFEHYHKDNYKLYNLCAERSYDHSKFHDRVELFPFYDHNAPPIQLIQDCCYNVDKWLSDDPQHIVGINCKAGKGRTGLIICCYLLHSNACGSTDEALDMYGHKRTKDGKGVTIASQIRYIRYYEKLIKDMNHQIPVPPRLTLQKLRITSFPKINGYPYVIIEMNNKITHKSKDSTVDRKKKQHEVTVDGNVEGDCKITLALNTGTKKITKICHFWFNTGFIENNHVRLEKPTIDVANKDKKSKVFKDDFAIEAFFGPCTTAKPVDTFEDSSNEAPKPENSEDEEDGNGRKRTKSFYDYEEYKGLDLELEEESKGSFGDTEESEEKKNTTKNEKSEKNGASEKNGSGKPEKDKKEEKVPKKPNGSNGLKVKGEGDDAKRKSKQTLLAKKDKKKK